MENGLLFILKRVGDITDRNKNWTDELWMYGLDGAGKKLYSGKGITFILDDKADFAAIPYENHSGESAVTGVILINIDDPTMVKKYDIDLASCVPDEKIRRWIGGIELLTWNKNGNEIWGEYTGEYGITGCFWGLNVLSNDISYYQTDYKYAYWYFNPERLVAVYNDRLNTVDADSWNEWRTSHPTYGLYLYLIDTKESVRIDTTSSDEGGFKIVEWVTPDQLLYYASGVKKTYSLKESI